VQDQLDRRRFLQLVGAGAVAAAGASLLVGSGTAEAADPGLDAIVGVISRRAGQTLSVLTSTGGTISVVVDSHTKLYSGIYGRVTSVRDLILGDRVLAVGQSAGGTLYANDVGTAFAPFTFTVRDVDDPPRTAQTEIGPVELTGMNLPDVGRVGLDPTTLTTGALVEGLSWRDPRDAKLYLVAGTITALEAS